MAEHQAEYRVYSVFLGIYFGFDSFSCSIISVKKYKDLSVLPLCFSFTILHPAFLHSLTAIPLTDLSNLIFSAVEVSQRLEKTYFLFVFCLCLYRKKYSEQQRQQVKLYLCAVLDIHALLCMHPSFSHVYFFSAAMQTDIFTELSKTTPPSGLFSLS